MRHHAVPIRELVQKPDDGEVIREVALSRLAERILASLILPSLL